MKLLYDTHLLLWAAGFPGRLPARARETLEDPEVQPVFSAASIWEIAIKQALGRADFRAEPQELRRGLLENDYEELAIDGRHAAAVGGLPSIHGDPFDRMLIAQAQVEGMRLLTSDRILGEYPGPVEVV
ncbi:type II toxin-antitoxin system VapC family toxin [Amaricoccus macauensis]|uniref:type II toxin-antitoxin system VapC family toxin n=1 Tax=Amaricoccus macauensis TaxID=57001 RepID=UPI003C7C16D9